jgi:hypothetical protein
MEGEHRLDLAESCQKVEQCGRLSKFRREEVTKTAAGLHMYMETWEKTDKKKLRTGRGGGGEGCLASKGLSTSKKG